MTISQRFELKNRPSIAVVAPISTEGWNLNESVELRKIKVNNEKEHSQKIELTNVNGWSPTESVNLVGEEIDAKEMDIYKIHY